MSKTRNYSGEYRNYHSQPAQKKRRAQRNKARRKMQKQGKDSPRDGSDVDHKNGNPYNNSSKNLRKQSPSKNRSIKRNSKAQKKKK